MMAKNVIQKKQRIAHNKTFNNEDHEMLPENYGDFLSSIIEGMNYTDYMSVHSNSKFETQFPKTQAASKTTIPIQNPILPKSKKFCLTRDCPLMKKCQKDLKQLKHNRMMPKPRAHLASLSESPVRKSPSMDSRSVSNAKLKKPKAASSLKKNPEKSKTGKQPKPSVPNRNLEQSSQKQESFSNKNNSRESRVKNVKTTLSNTSVENVKTTLSNTSSDSDDYEKFIRKEKKQLPKKCKKQVNIRTKNVATKQKTFPKPLPSDRESEESDEEFKVSESYKKRSKSDSSEESDEEECTLSKSQSKKSTRRRRKRDSSEESDDEFIVSKSRCKKKRRQRKRDSSEESDGEFIVSKSYQKKNKKETKNAVVEKRLPASNEDSESEMDMNNDVPCHDSSSESDDLTPLSELQNYLESSSNPHSDNSRQYGLFSHVKMSTSLTMEYGQPSIAQNTLNPASSFINQPSPSVFPSSASLKDNRLSSTHKINSVQSPSTALNNVQPSISRNSSIDSKINSVQSPSTAMNNVQPSISCNSSIDSKINSVQSPSTAMNNVQPTISRKSSIDSKINSVPISSNTYSASSNVVGKGACSTKNDLSDVRVKQENSDTSVLVDLTESDNECDPSFTVMPKIVAVVSEHKPPVADTDEDSDVEMIDAILLPRKDENTPQNPSNITDQSHIKTENKNPTLSNGNTQKQADKLQTSYPTVPVKSEPVFSTDICKEMAEVKTEPGDDIEIIEIVPSNKTSQNLNKTQAHSNKTVKIEKDSKVVKQTTVVNPLQPKEPLKVKEIASPVHSNATSTCNENPTFDYAYVTTLLDKLNSEFHTYQEIVHAEKSVEDTFKLLEMRQAEKCEFLKEQIDKIILNLPSIGDDQRDALRAMLMNSSQLKSRKTPLCTNIPSSDISIKDLKAIAAMKIVPLSSISEMDIKPDVSKLQSSIKKEPGTSAETSNESFGEKCVVCSKDAKAACQQCAKVFFCSHECGKKYWNEGHKDACAK